MNKHEYINRQPDVPPLLLQGGKGRYPRWKRGPFNNPLSNSIDKGMNTADAAMVDTILIPQWVITVNGRTVPTW
jgi:hypothetical protein